MKSLNDVEELPDYIDSIVIGASQSGLSISYCLQQAGQPHIVLEKDCVGSSWTNRRWDSFCLVTPNWMLRLPGYHYQGDDPDGFIKRDEIVDYLESYAATFKPSIYMGVAATRLYRDENGFVVETTSGNVRTKSVFLCVGYFHEPNLPAYSSNLDQSILQIHSRDYKNPDRLPEGGVLVVGSGQSGAQIAEELHEAERQTWLAVSSAVREPRSYRGKDTNYWYDMMGGFAKTFSDIDDPKERYTPNPHCSGKNGGHALNLEKFAQDGINLAGRVSNIEGTVVSFQDNLVNNVDRADTASREYMQSIDNLINDKHLKAPEISQTNTDDGVPDQKPVLQEHDHLDLKQHGINSIVWATGFHGNYDWIDFPVLDKRGYPDQRRGVTNIPGLYFCGLHWMHCLKSGLFFGVGDDADYVVTHFVNNN